jgi:hypothetical protein
MEDMTAWVKKNWIIVAVVVLVCGFMLFGDGAPDFSSFGEGK